MIYLSAEEVASVIDRTLRNMTVDLSSTNIRSSAVRLIELIDYGRKRYEEEEEATKANSKEQDKCKN